MIFRRSKYNNKKTIIDGIVFDSIREARRYQELKLLQKVGKISELELQPRYELIPKYKKNNKTIRKTEYVADFRYKDEKGNIVVEDVKGTKTELYKLKKKLLEYLYKDIEIKEI